MKNCVLLSMCLQIFAFHVNAVDLRITQILYNSNNVDSQRDYAEQWVEIYNAGAEEVNLAGYVFDDDDGVELAQANISSGKIYPGETAYLFNGDQLTAGQFVETWGRCNYISVTGWSGIGWADKIGIWANYTSYDNDHVTQALAVDSISYTYSGNWPESSSGYSIYLKDVNAVNRNDGSNWALTSITNRGTKASAGGMFIQSYSNTVGSIGGVYAAVDNNPWDEKNVFAYHAFEGSIPSNVSPLTSLGNIVHQVGQDIIKTDRGNGFSDRLVVDFAGYTEQEYVQGYDYINTKNLLGNDSFGIEVWFKPDSVSGVGSLFSTTGTTNGFSIKRSSDMLQVEVKFLDNTGIAVAKTLLTPSILTLGNWYYAIVKVQRLSSTYLIRIYVDGELQATQEYSDILPNGSICQPTTEKPMIGAEPLNNVGTSQFFNGQVYGVRVQNKDYVLEDYCRRKLVRDGSSYLGDIAYWDLPTFDSNVEYQMFKTASQQCQYADVLDNNLVGRLQCPFLNDNYVPQGLAYDYDHNLMYLTMFFRTEEGETRTYPSILVEIDMDDGSLQRVFQLKKSNGTPLTGALGGAGYYNGHVFVNYGPYVYFYSPVGSYYFNSETLANSKGDQNPLLPVRVVEMDIANNDLIEYLEMGYDSYTGKWILWAGQKNTDGTKKLLGYHASYPYTVYDIDATPDYVLPLPSDYGIQGIVAYTNLTTDSSLCFYMSVSGSPGKIDVLLYSRSTGSLILQDLCAYMPIGMEDLTMIGDAVWSVSESGARAYQKQIYSETTSSAWVDLYPYIFGIE